jgi:hypothetical protein
MTAVQQVFSDLLALHPRLFNINSVEGREFVHHFHKYLAVEKEQIVEAFGDGAWILLNIRKRVHIIKLYNKQ